MNALCPMEQGQTNQPMFVLNNVRRSRRPKPSACLILGYRCEISTVWCSCRLGLFKQYIDSFVVERIFALRSIGDGDKTQLAVLAQGTDQTEYDPLLRGLREVQIAFHQDIHQVFGDQPSQAFVNQIVGRAITSFLSQRRAERAGLVVDTAGGKELKHLIGKRCAALRRLISIA